MCSEGQCMSCWSTQLRCKLQLPEVSEEQQSCLDLTARASLLTYLLTYLLVEQA